MDELRSRLGSVRPTARGYVALCPAHADRNPSLSVAEADDGKLLIKCFAGCDATDIVAALGLELSNLYPDWKPRSQRRPVAPKPRPPDWRRTSRDLLDHVDALALRAERLLQAARYLDISDWSDDELNAAMKAVGKGYRDKEWGDLLTDTVFNVRCRGLEAEAKRRAHAA